MTGFKLPLALSLAAHAICLMLLLLLPSPAPPVPPPPVGGGIEVAFAPSVPEPEKTAAPRPPVKVQPPPPPVETLPPPAPEESTAVAEPAPPPPPEPKPAFPLRPKSIPKRIERRQPNRVYPETSPPAFTSGPSAPAAAPQTAFAPPAPVRAPAPSAEISPSYRAQLSEWLESHKRYPESARENSEQGRAVLRFVVERSGRVADFAVVDSTGYPDLDAALQNMMRGATLPPFPAGMDEQSIEVSVAIRFSLGR